jgi:hypothetical protein
MPPQVVFITAAMLFSAILPLPGWYDDFLRLVAFGTFAWGAYRNFQIRLSLLPVLYTLLAVLFNPIAPVVLAKAVWIPIDLGAGALLLATRRQITG